MGRKRLKHPLGGLWYRSQIVNLEILGICPIGYTYCFIEHHLCFIMIQDQQTVSLPIFQPISYKNRCCSRLCDGMRHSGLYNYLLASVTLQKGFQRLRNPENSRKLTKLGVLETYVPFPGNHVTVVYLWPRFVTKNVMKSSSFRVSRIPETPKLAKTNENCGKPGI